MYKPLTVMKCILNKMTGQGTCAALKFRIQIMIEKINAVASFEQTKEVEGPCSNDS